MASRTQTIEKPKVSATARTEMNGSSLPPVKQMVRGIGAIADGNGVFTAQQVDNELGGYYAQGYKLFSAHVEIVGGPARGGGAPNVEHWRAFYILTLE